MIKSFIKKNKTIYVFLVNQYERFLLALREFTSLRFRLCPISSHKIVFDNFSGKGYGGNPRLIAEELLKQSEKLDLVWLVNDLNSTMPNSIRKIKMGTKQAYYELSTASIWIDNVKDSSRPKKRNSQYYIQTWHGAARIKAVENDASNSLPKSYLRKSKRDSKEIDLFVAESKMTHDSLPYTFWYKGEVLDASFNKYNFEFESAKERVFDSFGLDRDTKILLYVPTFRRSGELDCYNIDYGRVVDTCEKVYGGKWIAIVRLHPVISRFCDSIDYNSRILDGTNYNSVESLIATSEAIITDFSNCMFDAYKLKKKVFLYASDYEEYVRSDRRLYFDLDSMPSPMCTNMDELIYAIENFNDSDYEIKRQKLIDKIGFYENDAAEICCERIVNITGENDVGNIKTRQ